MLVVHVHQLHLMVQTVVGILMVGEHEVENAHGVDCLQLEVPLSLYTLALDGEGGVEDAAVFEILLLGLLHLHDEELILVVLAIHVEDCPAVAVATAEVLAVEILQVVYLLLAVEKRVEETDEQFLVERGAEKLLESKIRVGIDVARCFQLFQIVGLVCHCFNFFCKYSFFSLNGKTFPH